MFWAILLPGSKNDDYTRQQLQPAKHTQYSSASKVALAAAEASLVTQNGGFRYDPLLYLQTRSRMQLREILSSIGAQTKGIRSMERALTLHPFAGDFFLPLAVPALAVTASGSCLAVGRFDCSVTGEPAVLLCESRGALSMERLTLLSCFFAFDG